MTANSEESPALKVVFWNHPLVIRVRDILMRAWSRFVHFPPVRFLERMAKALAGRLAPLARRLVTAALRIPWIRRGATYGQEKMKVPLVRNMVYMLVLMGLFFGAIFGFEAFMGSVQASFMATIGQLPQTVSTVEATAQPWQKAFHAVGSLRAENGADLSSEASGIVETLNFKSGDDVQEGAVLLTLRAEDDIAKLASLKATARLADITYQRDLEQYKIQGVSQETLDTDAANLANDNALVDQQQEIINLKVVKAPFSGRLGIRAVDIGQYLGAGTTIVTLQALDHMYMDFYLPQQQVAQIEIGQDVTVKVDTYPNTPFVGKITATNPLIDSSSRNMQVRATIDNPEHKLLPGMYGTVSIAIGAPANQVTLPQTTLTFNPFGTTVYLVKSKPQEPSLWQWLWRTTPPPHLSVAQSFVTTGDTRGDQIEILSGVKVGDTVVGAGQMKLHNGSNITVNNAVLPTDDPAPVLNAEP
jgi:membrane fusion protein (multidrug efflux system)